MGIKKNGLDVLKKAARELADDVETVARDSFALSSETFLADWAVEDQSGYLKWRDVKEALAAIEEEGS